MYDYLQTYLEISAMTLRMPNPETKILYEGYPGGAGNSNANRCTARLVSLNQMAEQYRLNRASPRGNLIAAVQPWTDTAAADIVNPMGARTGNPVNIYQNNNTHTFAGVIAPAAVNAAGAPLCVRARHRGDGAERVGDAGGRTREGENGGPAGQAVCMAVRGKGVRGFSGDVAPRRPLRWPHPAEFLRR
jgi:hypothetical protein